MNKDYEIKELEKIIDTIRFLLPKNESLILLYTRLFLLRDYFWYAVSEVHIQEENIRKMENGEHRNFSTHEEYQESEMRIDACAISSYAHMRTCLHFAKIICETEKDYRTLKIREKYKNWAIDLIDKRDRIQAHPYEEWDLAGDTTGRCSDGRVFLNTRNLIEPNKSRKITLSPRKDLEALRNYLQTLFRNFNEIYIQQRE